MTGSGPRCCCTVLSERQIAYGNEQIKDGIHNKDIQKGRRNKRRHGEVDVQIVQSRRHEGVNGAGRSHHDDDGA